MRKSTLGIAFALATIPWLSAQALAQSPLADLAMHGDFGALKTQLGKEVELDVDAPRLDGSTALHWAVHYDDRETVDLLLAAGADPGAMTDLGATPLYIAAVSGNAALIKTLLEAGADADEAVLEGEERPLMFAARAGSVESVVLLLDAGADIDAREMHRGTTALLWAAEHDHADVVRLLIERGANPNARSAIKVGESRRGGAALPTGGLSALMLAARENAVDTARVLLEEGALVNQQSAEGHTALLTAVQNGHHALATLLIEHGADVNLANDRGWNPLYMAVKMRSLEQGTMPNPEIDLDGMYALIELLLERGADVNARLLADTEVHNAIRSTWLNETGATPFLRAALCGDLAVMKLLLAHGADPLIATTDGTTALMALAGVGYTKGFMQDVGSVEESLEAMQLLIDLGIDIDAANAEEVRALHGAAHKNFVEGIQLLVDHGADLSARSMRRGQFVRTDDFPGNTPLDWADGLQTGMESAIYNAEAVELLEKLLTERGLPIERLSNTAGGRVAQQ